MAFTGKILVGELSNKMRVISGSLKGKKINYLKNIITRPLKDSVKENIFNILNHSNLINTKVEKANILDLYSGVGSFGIECLSRGANKVTFIETDIHAASILKKNLLQLSLINKSVITRNSVENFLNSNLKEKYQFFFFDPPFADNNFIENLNIIKQKKIFEANNTIIIHREKKTNDNFKDLIEVKIVKKYGRSKIIIGNFI